MLFPELSKESRADLYGVRTLKKAAEDRPNQVNGEQRVAELERHRSDVQSELRGGRLVLVHDRSQVVAGGVGERGRCYQEKAEGEKKEAALFHGIVPPHSGFAWLAHGMATVRRSSCAALFQHLLHGFVLRLLACCCVYRRLVAAPS